MKQLLLSELQESINNLEALKKSELKLSERIKVERSICKIEISMRIIRNMNVTSYIS